MSVYGTTVFSSAGLSQGLSTTSIILTDTPQPIPASGNVLENRNAISIRNVSTETIYLGASSVTVENGYPKYQNEEFIADLTGNESVFIYGVCASGVTAEIRIMQVA